MYKLWRRLRSKRHSRSALSTSAKNDASSKAPLPEGNPPEATLTGRNDTPVATDTPGTMEETVEVALDLPEGDRLKSSSVSSLDDDADFLIEYEDEEDDSPPVLAKIASPVTLPGAVPYSLSEDITSIEADTSIPNLEAGSGSPRRSYLGIYPSTIQTTPSEPGNLTSATTLFVWHATFHPAVGRRFSSVDVEIKFSTPPTVKGASTVKVIKFAPHKAYGAITYSNKTISWGLELPITIPVGPVSIGATPSTNHQTTKEIQHAFTITGSARGPQRNTCVWTIEENDSTERGVPSELQLAVLVQHAGPVMVEVDISGWTAGGFFPSHRLRPKTGAEGRRKVFRPERYKGQLDEYNLDDDKGNSAVNMLDKWTGRVDGAMLQFDQDVVRA